MTASWWANGRQNTALKELLTHVVSHVHATVEHDIAPSEGDDDARAANVLSGAFCLGERRKKSKQRRRSA